jgi:hypothetical protein
MFGAIPVNPPSLVTHCDQSTAKQASPRATGKRMGKACARQWVVHRSSAPFYAVLGARTNEVSEANTVWDFFSSHSHRRLFLFLVMQLATIICTLEKRNVGLKPSRFRDAGYITLIVFPRTMQRPPCAHRAARYATRNSGQSCVGVAGKLNVTNRAPRHCCWGCPKRSPPSSSSTCSFHKSAWTPSANYTTIARTRTARRQPASARQTGRTCWM